MHNNILSHTISNYTINHIKSSNIIKWLTVIQTKWEKKEKVSQKEIPTDWESEETKKKTRVREKMETLEESKTDKQQFIRSMYTEERQK